MPVLFDPGSRTLLAASASGLAISVDRAVSWRFHTEGLHAGYARAVAVAGDTILVSASTGPSTERSAVYRTAILRGKTFQRCRRGLPDWFTDHINTFCLTASGSSVAFGTSDGRVFRSSDEGQNWKLVRADITRVLFTAFGVAG